MHLYIDTSNSMMLLQAAAVVSTLTMLKDGILIVYCSDCSSSMVAWPNGKALDYESRDSRFDPWRDHFCSFVAIIWWLLPRRIFFRGSQEAQTSLSVVLSRRNSARPSSLPPSNSWSSCIQLGYKQIEIFVFLYVTKLTSLFS